MTGRPEKGIKQFSLFLLKGGFNMASTLEGDGGHRKADNVREVV